MTISAPIQIIQDVRWFCGRTNVGIVRVMNQCCEIKYYIASVEGGDEQKDMEFIASWGSSFPKPVGDMLFGVNAENVDKTHFTPLH